MKTKADSAEMAAALVAQAGQERMNGQTYRALGRWAATNGFKGSARKFFHESTHEEEQSCCLLKFVNKYYGIHVQEPGVEALKLNPASLLEAHTQALQLELENIERLKALQQHADMNGQQEVETKLEKLVQIAIHEVEDMREIVQVVKNCGSNEMYADQLVKDLT